MNDPQANNRPTPGRESDQLIVDLKHLYEFASGDRAHAERFLQLFIEQSEIDLSNLIASKTSETWRDAAHSLKSGAGGIGAWKVVQAAELAQNEALPLTTERCQHHIEILTGRIAEVIAFIKNHRNQG